MESGTDRLPRRTGLCVLFHTHQLLIVSSGPWTKWWSTRWIHGSWWNVPWWWRCWCFGIGSQRDGRSTRRNGNMRSGLITRSRMRIRLMNWGSRWCAITIRVIRIEFIDTSIGGNRKWSGCWRVIFPWYRSIRRVGCFLTLLWLWVKGGGDPLLRANWHRDRVPGDFTSRWETRWIVWVRIRIRHKDRAVSTSKFMDGCSLSMWDGGRKVVGRRFGSGFSTMWDGIPPCVTIVGGADDGGKGTNVCKLRDLMLSRRRFWGGKESSHSMEGSKKGRSPAK